MSFRHRIASFLGLCQVVMAPLAVQAGQAPQAELSANSISQMQQMLAAGELTSEDLVKAYLSAIEAKVSYNTFITVDERNALAVARERDEQRDNGKLLGALHGIPFAIKDNIHVAGLPNTAGTKALEGFVPTEDADVVAKLRAAGAIILGKNNLHELAYGITSNNYSYGPVRNAHNPEYFAGGSSGGTAASVALGLVAAGLGTDTGGSVRIPPALNGIVGFRPTTGRYPSGGLTSISTTRDTVGAITRTVTDAILVDSVLAGEAANLNPVNLEGLRIGVPRAYFYDDLDADVASTMGLVLEKLKAAGVILVEADIVRLAELNGKVGFPIVIYETGQLLPDYLSKNMPAVTTEQLLAAITSPDVKAVVGEALGGAITEQQYIDAKDIQRPALRQTFSDYFSQHRVEAVIFPTTALPARPIENSLETIELNGKQQPTFPSYIRNTDSASNAALPGLSLPAGLSRLGLPIGVEIDGPEGSDSRLLAIGLALENLLAEK